MNKRAAAQYLDKMFGTRQGHVAVAHKGKGGESWEERQFAWPSQKAALLVWAEAHANDNVFICPALRGDPNTRKKGDMLPTRWLWADVDWQAIPKDKHQDVQARIKELGGYIVASGSGDNVHVYVQLTKAVDHTTFIKLNTGLRDYLYGDNKQADNSLLRLPGTTNWKTDEGVEVAERGGNGKAVSSESLLRRRVFRDARVPVDVEASDWQFVEVEGLPRRVRATIEMSPAEAKARYGTRHKAVNASVKELHKRGFDPDQIHSLLHRYPPAVSKMAEENGYDLHHDIDRCIARLDTIAEVAPELTPEERDELDDEMEVVSDEESAEMDTDEIRRMAEVVLRRRQADKMAREIEAERSWIAPPADASWTLTDVLKDPPAPAQYLIGIPPSGKRGLCGAKHNVIITAQYKTGKTRFVISTIAKALCDGDDFMGDVPVHTASGDEGVVVGHWNCEMDAAEIASDYVIPAQIKRTDNLRGVNLRGQPVNLLSPQGHRWAVQWLRGEIPLADGSLPPPVKVWTIDSLARLARMAGVSEKDNDEMFDLLMALDRVKVEAGVDVLFLITHTGRMIQEEGKERARGATAIDDWCDARWIMTNEGGTRFLAVDGRGVGMDATPLVYDEETGSSVRGFGGRAEVKADGALETIKRIVKDQPGITQKALYDILKSEAKMSQRVAAHHIAECVEYEFIEVTEDSGGRGRPAKRHYLTGYTKPEGNRRMNATPADIDLRGVSVRSRRLK